MQLRELREYSKRRGLEIYREYVDIGVSGSKESRPELDQLMADARRGRRLFDMVLCWKFDRFARSTKHLITALEEFNSLGIGFCSMSEAIDLQTTTGRLVFTFLSAIAEFERDLIRERVIAGVRNARANGKRLGRPPVQVDGKRICDLRGEGKSIRAIAAELNYSVGKVHSILRRSSIS